jgi:hypothetical protein
MESDAINISRHDQAGIYEKFIVLMLLKFHVLNIQVLACRYWSINLRFIIWDTRYSIINLEMKKAFYANQIWLFALCVRLFTIYTNY